MKAASVDFDVAHVADRLRTILVEALANPMLRGSLEDDTPLLGAMPELDSMGAVAIITGIEDSYGIAIDEEKLTADIFATFGSLRRFVEAKLHRHGSITIN
jgi:acyl carrier protein